MEYEPWARHWRPTQHWKLWTSGVSNDKKSKKQKDTDNTIKATGNKSGAEGARALSEALKANKTLKTLLLAGAHQSKYVTVAKRLWAFYHTGHEIGDGTRELSEAIAVNTTVVTLSLYREQRRLKCQYKQGPKTSNMSIKTGSRIDEKGAFLLSRALSINTTLIELNLEGEQSCDLFYEMLVLLKKRHSKH